MVSFTQVIETERLCLRPLKNQDAPFILQLFSNERVCQFLYDEEVYKSIGDALEFIEWHQPSEYNPHNRYGIELVSKGILIGTCGFHEWDQINHIAEIGYDLWYEYWGYGYMNESIQALLSMGFRDMNLNRIHAYVALENGRSQRLLYNLGFTNEGVFRDKYLFKGIYYDHSCYSLLKREWNNN